MAALVYLIHADPSMRARYEAALREAGVDGELVIVNAGGFSSAYVALAATLAKRSGTGSVLEGLLMQHPPKRHGWSSLVLGTFSAGYALARATLSRQADAERVSGYCAIDSVHTGLVGGKANPAQLGWLEQYGARANLGLCSLWVGHADVPTPQTGPSAFASTTQVAQALREALGPDHERWRLKAYNESRDPKIEHGLALTKWGPAWLAGCAAECESHAGELIPPTDPAPPSQAC
jgi:hypothetical protein